MNTEVNDSRINDTYPSRQGQAPRILERIDPVVYCEKKESHSHINRSSVEHYENQGFVILRGLFSDLEISLFQKELDFLRNDPVIKESEFSISEPENNQIRSIFYIHEISPVFKKLASDSRLAGVAQFLLRDQVYVHQSRLNYKLGFRGKEFYWHSDFETWHVEDGMPQMRALSMSLMLSENLEQNGPLLVVPGSHQNFLSCQDETPDDHYKDSLRRQEYGVPSDDALTDMVDNGGIISATGKPGDLILFDCNIMHGSNSNITPYPRSSLFFVFNAMSNRVTKPFGQQNIRPEFVCSREKITPIVVTEEKS